jgi:hypothetical protein
MKDAEGDVLAIDTYIVTVGVVDEDISGDYYGATAAGRAPILPRRVVVRGSASTYRRLRR